MPSWTKPIFPYFIVGKTEGPTRKSDLLRIKELIGIRSRIRFLVGLIQSPMFLS